MSKPAVGGITFYIIFLLAVACYSVFFSPSQVFYNAKFVGLLLSMALGFIIGLADDAYDTKPFLKFFIQFACGLIMFTSGIRIEVFDFWFLNLCLTVFWVVGIMNSVNMLDNMDGITTLVSLGIILSVIVIIVSNGDLENMHLIILIGLIGALFSFLYFNWNPSRMYMGDTGSQFLGALLAAIGILYLWNDVYSDGQGIVSRKIVLVIMSFILPIIDTTCLGCTLRATPLTASRPPKRMHRPLTSRIGRLMASAPGADAAWATGPADARSSSAPSGRRTSTCGIR